MAGSFEAQISEWAAKTEKRMTAVFREAAQTVANEVRKPRSEGGNMPILTGNLRRSLLASTSSMPIVRPGAQEFPENDSQITLTIAGAEIGQTIFLGFQADYAVYQEFGARGLPGNGFVRLTAQRWPEIVADASRTIQSRVESR